jgi:co-chaperonin GroES (HSP10)
MKVLHNNVLVLPDPAPEKLGALYVPENAQDSTSTLTGTISEVGPGFAGKAREMQGLRKGMRILYSRPSSRPLELDGVEYHMMSAGEILAEVPEGEKDAE